MFINSSLFSIDGDDTTKDFKILEFSTSKNQNLLENLERGAYCSHRIYLNPLTFEYTAASQRIFKLVDYSGKIENLGEDIDVVLPSLSEKDSRTLASVPSRYVCGILDIGTTDTKVSELGNADPARIHSQSMMRYNQLMTQVIDITIPLKPLSLTRILLPFPIKNFLSSLTNFKKSSRSFIDSGS